MLEYDRLVFDEENEGTKKLEKDNEKDGNNIYKFFKLYLENNLKLGANFHGKGLKDIVNKKLVTPLISTTERVVDMVLSVRIRFNLT